MERMSDIIFEALWSGAEHNLAATDGRRLDPMVRANFVVDQRRA